MYQCTQGADGGGRVTLKKKLSLCLRCSSLNLRELHRRHTWGVLLQVTSATEQFSCVSWLVSFFYFSALHIFPSFHEYSWADGSVSKMRFMSTLWWVFTQNTWFCFFLASVRVLQRTSISTNIKVRCNTECYFVKFFVSISGTFGVQGWSIALNGFVSAAETNFFVYTELSCIQVTALRDLIQRGWVSIMASLVSGVEI